MRFKNPGVKLPLHMWIKIHNDLMWLQVSEYNYKETCADLEYEFLFLDRTQAMIFISGKFLGAVKPKFTEYLK